MSASRFATAETYRRCAKCRSRRLALVPISRGHVRKECTACGSTGPFEVTPPGERHSVRV